jgi:23S rRNA (guanosine2251-2'-O)-methyltransferase
VSDLLGGRRPVAEALRAGRGARRLWISRSAKPSPEIAQIEQLARSAGLRVERVAGDWIRDHAGFDGHQGVLLEVDPRQWADLDAMLARAVARHAPPLVLVLEALQDPVNFGTLLRSAEAAGVDGVIFPERGAAPLSAAAVNASGGASEHLLLARVESLGGTIHELKERGIRVVAAEQEASATAWQSDLRGPLAIVVGSEGSGVSGAMRRRCDLLVRFPMTGQVASLNAATAGALLLFEVVRQRSDGDGR